MQPATSTPPADFKPHLFGKFYLLQRLAVGGMAEIYRAKLVGAAGFEKELAVKRVLAARAQNDGFIRMLVNEAKLTAQLTHSNIAQIYECDVVGDTSYIAMELVYGVSMKEMMASFARAGTPLEPEQAIFLVLQLLQGLDYAHRKVGADGEALQIVHCDVSPDNALVSWEGELKLLDFGIARAVAGLSNYKEGMLMGKLGYVAPEQASVERAWDHRVDVFAAGIVLYELLTGQKPFPKATDVPSLIASRKAKVPSPSAIDDRLPRELDGILERALAIDPESRYPSARAFADGLVDVLFPTPHSAIQELLGQKMQRVFAERISRQRAARAHDALVVKVLGHAREAQLEVAPVTPRPLPAIDFVHPPPPPAVRPQEPGARRRTVVRRGWPWWASLALALLAATVAGSAVWYAGPLLRPGVVVVTSEPAGARVSVDGSPIPGVTPLVIEDVPQSRALELAVTSRGRRSWTATLPPEPGHLVRRAHGVLPSALGPLTLDSEPRGAQVTLDDARVGVTPLTVEGVRLDEPHRIDLRLPGRELNQFVVIPERDGQRFVRKLTPREPPRAAPEP